MKLFICVSALALAAAQAPTPEDDMTGLQVNSPLRGTAGSSIGTTQGTHPAVGSRGSADGTSFWTPWYNDDKPTGLGDMETYNMLNQHNNLCGRSPNADPSWTGKPADITQLAWDALTPVQQGAMATSIDWDALTASQKLAYLSAGGDTSAQAVQCRVAGTTVAAANAGQTVVCTADAGAVCANADNAGCFTKPTVAGWTTDVTCSAIAGEDACLDNVNCQWGCYDYEVRFECEDHWDQPTPSPTYAPTTAPTNSPTLSPTMHPTPAPSPSGHDQFAADGTTKVDSTGVKATTQIAFLPQQNWVHNGHFTHGAEGWHADVVGTVLEAKSSGGLYTLDVMSSQQGGSPGVYTYLDTPGQDTFSAGQNYVMIIKGFGAATQFSEGWTAQPYINCLVGTSRQDLTFSSSLNAENSALPPMTGTFLTQFTTTADATECKAGVRFTGTQSSSQMTLEEFEIRPTELYEDQRFNDDLAMRSNGAVANSDFGIGSLYWQRINSMDEVWMNGVELVVWNHGTPSGPHNGVQQTGISLEPLTKYSLTVNGHLQRNDALGGNAYVFVSKTTTDQNGVEVTTDISEVGSLNTNLRLAVNGFGNTELTFTTHQEVAAHQSTTYNVGIRFDSSAPADVEMLIRSIVLDAESSSTARVHGVDDVTRSALPGVRTHEQYMDILDQARAAKTITPCDCDPAVHASKATKCYSTQVGWEKRNNVVRVVHRRSMVSPNTYENIGMDQADQHKCAVIDGACKCCDCKDGVRHGFNMEVASHDGEGGLKDGRKFTIRFNRAFTNDAGDIKPGMTGTCRFHDNQWCCACTNSWLGDDGTDVNNRCPFEYGDEFCNAYDGTSNPEGINFWGRNYHFKEYHRCVTPAAHHVCGENVQANKAIGQDVGHLPYFDNNAANEYDGFTILNNAQALSSAVADYTKHVNKRALCSVSRADQVGGLAGQQVLAASDCAALCNADSNCMGFNYIPVGAETQDRCEFLQSTTLPCASTPSSQSGSDYYSKDGHVPSAAAQAMYQGSFLVYTRDGVKAKCLQWETDGICAMPAFELENYQLKQAKQAAEDAGNAYTGANPLQWHRIYSNGACSDKAASMFCYVATGNAEVAFHASGDALANDSAHKYRATGGMNRRACVGDNDDVKDNSLTAGGITISLHGQVTTSQYYDQIRCLW